MKKSAGFTLIELVIVIVILGILGAVAAPRFINMQGDAYEANVKALKGSIQSAMTLANTKAILGGYDSKKGPEKGEKELSEVQFVYGFPAATQDGIVLMLQDTSSFGKVEDDKITGKDATSAYVLSEYRDAVATATDTSLKIHPQARVGAECYVEYTQATDRNEPATVTAVTTGC